MLRKDNNTRRLFVAAGLVLTGFLVNWALFYCCGNFPLKPGHFFYYIAATSFGPLGGLFGAAFGALPEAFITGGQSEACAVVLSLLLFSLVQNRGRAIPAYFWVMLLWSVVILPLFLHRLPNITQTNSWSNTQVFAAFLSHLIFAATAETILFNQDISFALTERPRHPTPELFVPRILGLFAVTLVWAVISFVERLGLLSSSGLLDGALWAAVGFTAATVAFATLLGSRLVEIVLSEPKNSMAGNLITTPVAVSFAEHSSLFRQLSAEQVNLPNDGICILDHDKRISFMNDYFRELFGISKELVVGESLKQLIVDTKARSRIEWLLDSPQREQTVEVRVPSPDGSLAFIELMLIPKDITDSGNGISIIAKDVSDRSKVERHLLQAQRLSALGDFVTGLAHSFNNSLTAIIGRASHARYLSSLPDIREALRDIVNAAAGAGEISRKLLEFAHAEPAGLRETNIAETIPQHLKLLERLVGERHPLKFTSGFDTLNAFLDPVLVTQALTNLVLNARDSYEGQGGPISVCLDVEEIDNAAAVVNPVARPGTFARLRISDEGAGMNTEVLGRAFEPLFSTKREQGHSGLGLSSVFAIVRAHDGFLTTESKPEKGTTVSLYFPINSQEQAASASRQNHSQPAAFLDTIPGDIKGNNEQILIVDDEETLRSTVCTMLELLGYRANACKSRDEAVEYLRSNDVDLIVVDAYLPTVSGFDLLREIKKDSRNTQALMMSGAAVRPETLPSGTSILLKPFDLIELGNAIKNAMIHGVPA